MKNKQKTDKNTYYWVKNSKANKFLIKDFKDTKFLLFRTILGKHVIKKCKKYYL